jgi:type I restriction enzyme M protein
MPHSATTGSTARERSIRQSMVEHGVVRCVVALPGHLFRETTVPVTVWILAGPGTDPSHGVLLVDADAAARRESPTHRVLTGGGCQAVLDAFKGWSNGSPPPAVPIDAVSATAATVAEIRDHDYDLQPAVYLSERRRVTAEQRISERLSNLPAELAQLDAAARAADLALDRLLERLNLWTQ